MKYARVKNILRYIKRITYKHMLAVIVLVILFYTAWVSFPQTLFVTGAYLRDADKGDEKASIREQLAKEYREMLDFSGNVLNDKGTYINLNGLVARILGQREVNERVKLNNGHLALIVDRPQGIATPTSMLTALCDRQKANGKYFLFVIAPSEIPKYEQILPAGYVDYSNQNADKLLDALRNNDVPVLDLREELYNDNISYDEALCVTDHHWKPATGFWAYTKIIDHLKGAGIVGEIDPMYTDIGSYNVEVYKDWFLGSSGKRTGIYFAGVDDFAIITPKFGGDDMTVEIPSWSVYRKGFFVDIAYNMGANRLDYFSGNPYMAYGHSDSDFMRYRNASAPIDLRIMSIGDSCTNIPCTFLPLVFSTCDELDMRHYQKNFEEYYAEYDPDVVIVLIGASSVNQPNTTYRFFSN